MASTSTPAPQVSVTDAARDAITKLTDSGEISQSEATLLGSEADRLLREMCRKPPTDSHVSCYFMVEAIPARESLERIAKRLPLLKTLAESGDINAAALAKVLPSVEADLTMLASEEQLKKLPPAERTRAEELAPQAVKALDELRALLIGAE